MKICGRTQMLDQYSFCDSFKVMKNLGFDGVEICLETRKWEVRQELFDSSYLEACKEVLQEVNMSTFSLSYHCDYIHDDICFEYFKKAIPVARSLGTQIFVFSGGRKQSGDADEWDLMVNRTKELVEIAESNGIILANEPEPRLVVRTTTDLIRLFDEINSDHLACNMDLGHSFLCDPEPLESIQKLGSKIVHVHIENMKQGIHNHLLPQEGDMDLEMYLNQLLKIGFDGGMALDLYKYNYQEVAPSAIDFLKNIINKVKGYQI